jgi:D-glycero-alpha-D-manno-heptose 1-phosphate guanylyltransferase
VTDEAIILAVGFGTRLKGVVKDTPKPMADINGKPFLEYLLRFLKRNGISKVVLAVGYRWKIIYDYFGESYEGIEIKYSIEDEPLGTGGAIKKALNVIEKDWAYILNGDTFFNIPLSELTNKVNNETRLIVALKKMYDFDRYGCVEIDIDGNVTGFKEKGFKSEGNINGGIYLASKRLFDSFNVGNKFSFETFIEKNFLSINMKAMVFDEYFIDIGIPEDYFRAQNEVNDYI